MKSMTCKELGGACDLKFHGDTFDELAEQSKNHGARMMEMGDGTHLKAMEEMKQKMMKPDEMNKWMEEKRNKFNSIPIDN